MDPKKRKIIIVIVSIVVIATILYFVLKKKDTPSSEVPATNPSAFPLKKGSTGPEVIQVQKYLNQKYSAGLAVDGIWGPKTNAAVTNFLQRDNISSDVYDKWELASIK
jgi:peptidoglycan hydrolase-like protein with peptidoglycan-binding domain